MDTIATQLQNTKGQSSGFDYLRLALATSVIAWHTILINYGSDVEAQVLLGPFRPIEYFILPGFFSLSGFLVTASLFRNRIPRFLMLRGLRIFPALFCQVLVSALIIGPLLTSLPLNQYFADPKFRSYLLNIVGLMHYQLPGLFLSNPFPDNVNIQLWTIKLELECYAGLAYLGASGIIRGRYVVAAGFLMMSALFIASAQFSGEIVNQGANGRLCLLSFTAGTCVYVWRDRIPFNGLMALAVFVLAWCAFIRAGTEYLASLPIAYLTAWLGLQTPKRNFLVNGVDYSYGIYLYGFPMQQAVAQLFPHRWYINIILSLMIAGLAAFLSWHLVESKAMALKKIVTRREELIPADASSSRNV
jgi:peptidoglycan/LPS O-acetylase OafA/YrhL